MFCCCSCDCRAEMGQMLRLQTSCCQSCSEPRGLSQVCAGMCVRMGASSYLQQQGKVPEESMQDIFSLLFTFSHIHPKVQQLGIKPVAVAGLGAGWEEMRVEQLDGSTSSVLSPVGWTACLPIWFGEQRLGTKETYPTAEIKLLLHLFIWISSRFEKMTQKPKHNPRFWR